MASKSDIIWKDRSHFMWFPIRFEKYYVRNNRIYCIHGLLNQKEHECQLYRVLDLSLQRTLLHRLFGTGTIRMKTNDSSDPILMLRNISDSRAVKDMLSDLVEEAREHKGMTEREIRATNGAIEDVTGDGKVTGADFL